MLTTIRILKPAFVVGENVAGLVSMDNGKTLDRILSDLANEGYTTEQFIIPACAVGAWHRRDRIWIVAKSSIIRRDDRCNNRKERHIQRNKGIAPESESEREGRECGVGKVSTITTDTLSQRRCGRDTGGEYAEDVRELRGGPTDGYWDSEPSVGRVANGIPNRVDRLKGLGNAIVPQVVFEIFKAIEKLTKPS